MPDVFSCPPTSKFQDRAQRVPLGGDKFLPVLASVEPGKRTPVCNLDADVFITNKASNLQFQDSSSQLKLSSDKKLWETFRLQSTGSYLHSVHILSDQNFSVSERGAGKGLSLSRGAAMGDTESWRLSEADDGAVYIAGNSGLSLAVHDGKLLQQGEKDARSQWLITLVDGQAACAFVEPTAAIVTLPGNYRETEWHFHDMGRVIRAREANAGVHFNSWDMKFARRLQPKSSFQPRESKVMFSGVPGSTLVVSIAFGDKACPAEKWAPHIPGTGDALLWTKPRQWIFSGPADDDKYPSSIEAIDMTLAWIKQGHKGLNMLIVTGFSAGGVVGLKWAIMSPTGHNGVYDAADGSKIPVRIILGGLGSYDYLNKKRPALSCSKDFWPTRNTSACHSCSTFLRPEGGSRRRSRPGVPPSCAQHYDAYPFGLAGLADSTGRVSKTYHRLVSYLKKHLQPHEHIAEEDDEDTCKGQDFDMDLGQGLDHEVLGNIKIHGDWHENKDEPKIGPVDGQRALLFKGPLTLTWEKKVSKLAIQYYDAQHTDSGVFTTNGAATKASRTEDGEVELTDDAGFTSVTLKGINAVLRLAGHTICPSEELAKVHRSMKFYRPAIRARFATKDIRFMLGEYDSVSCLHGACKESCVEEVQGADRLQRGLNYMGHLREALPGYVPVWSVYSDPQWFRHYHFGAWMSSAFQTWAFLERSLPPTLAETPQNWMPARQWNPQAWSSKYGVVCPLGTSSMWLYEQPDRCQSPESCQEKCIKDLFCRGFAMTSDSADGRCWLFNSVAVDKCEESSNYNLYYMESTTTTTFAGQIAMTSSDQNNIIDFVQEGSKAVLTDELKLKLCGGAVLLGLVAALTMLWFSVRSRVATHNPVPIDAPANNQDDALSHAETGSASANPVD